MSTTTKTSLFTRCALLVLVACEDPSSSAESKRDAASDDEAAEPASSTDARADGAGSTTTGEDAGSEGDASDCTTDPKSYLEIINACSDAEKIDKQPTLPLLRADGSLPDLP